MFGGHQQDGLRPGTESVPLAIGMATSLDLWAKEQDEHARRLTALHDRFESGLRAALPNIVVHGTDAKRLPQTSNIAFPGVDGEVLRMALDLGGVACSVGSACSSGSTELSPTLRAMELPNDLGKFLTALQSRCHDHRSRDRRSHPPHRPRLPGTRRMTYVAGLEFGGESLCGFSPEVGQEVILATALAFAV